MYCKMTNEQVNALKPVTAEPSDPLREGPDGRFYFYDETWSDLHGPYDSLEAVKVAITEYAKTL